MNVNYAEINNSKLADILRGAEKVQARLVEAGEDQSALAVQRLIRSRLAANSENRRANREYRETLAALTTAQAEIEALREALASVRAWAASLTVCDMNEIVADNGITAGMVVGQEANEQVRRIDRALSGGKP